MQKLIIGAVVGCFVIIAIMWSMDGEQRVSDVTQPESGSQAVSVVATFYPLQELARTVVGQRGAVTAIVPAGSEPHDYEPSPKDIKALYEADLVIINGAGMDPWAEKLVPELAAQGVATLVLAQSVNLLQGHDHSHADGSDEHTHDGHDEDVAAHSAETPELVADGEAVESDPHFWLDPLVAAGLVADVARILGERFPTFQAEFAANAESAKDRLSAIDQAYTSGLASCRLDEVVISHDAFRYLARHYGFETHALAGLSPDAEPSPKRLSELAAEAKAEGIKYIFFETLASPKLSETLAREVGAETLVFNPIEGVTAEEAAAGVGYFSLMESNLAALRKALECK